MGCCGPTVSKYDNLNKQGIYPPEQIDEVFTAVWDERDENVAITRAQAKEIVQESFNQLAEVGDNRQFDVLRFDKWAAKFTSMVTGRFSGKRQNLLDFLTELMAPPAGVQAPGPAPTKAPLAAST